MNLKHRARLAASLLASLAIGPLAASPGTAQEASAAAEREQAQTQARTETQAPAQAADDGDIIVTGRPEPRRADISRQARAIGRSSGSAYRNPIARFEGPVCPGVMGLPEELAEHMVGRIREIAERAGLRLAPENACRVNVVIAFVPDTRAGMEQVERAMPGLFDNVSRADRRAIYESSGPVRLVTAKLEKTRDGMPIPRDDGRGGPPVVEIPLAHSRIFLTTREDIEAVVLLFERAAVDGLSVVQLADYAAMRSFAETSPPRDEVLSMDTILTLFQPGAQPPQSLTAFDEAYLRSVYDGLPNMPAMSKMLGVNRQLRKMERESESADAD